VWQARDTPQLVSSVLEQLQLLKLYTEENVKSPSQTVLNAIQDQTHNIEKWSDLFLSSRLSLDILLELVAGLKDRPSASAKAPAILSFYEKLQSRPLADEVNLDLLFQGI
jgi:hypothetical protein